jgi:hypothetical protein
MDQQGYNQMMFILVIMAIMLFMYLIMVRTK